MPPGPASPASMPTIRNTSSKGAPNRMRDEARQDAGEHQERAEQNADTDSVEEAIVDSFAPLVMAARGAANR